MSLPKPPFETTPENYAAHDSAIHNTLAPPYNFLEIDAGQAALRAYLLFRLGRSVFYIVKKNALGL